MVYSPVLIPTLNRFEHFVCCIESLSKCKWADKTEVYVALDYPVKDSHKEGYKKIKRYLENCDNLTFKKLNVIERKKNYGIGVKGNLDKLRKEVLKKVDRIIISEDDNIFSQNFLVYINKGLELFENDNSVFAINGYSHPYNFKFNKNNYFRHNVDFSAWGYGIWRNRVLQYEKDINSDYIFRKRFSIKNIIRVKNLGYNRLLQYLAYSLRKYKIPIWMTDNVLSCYILIKGMTVIMPSISKVRNAGWDDEGQSFYQKGITKKIKKIANRHNNQTIDCDSDFSYIGDPWNYFAENNRIAKKESDGKISLYKFIYISFKLFCKTIFNKIK